jgi:hypothetical protein
LALSFNFRATGAGRASAALAHVLGASVNAMALRRSSAAVA